MEKPVGRDLASAQAINEVTGRVFDESQIFRIDHYLGKETVQNLMVVRFANSIFEPIWNHKYVDHVQITVSEAEGVGTRATYYEEAGALRDMVQNHLLQLLCSRCHGTAVLIGPQRGTKRQDGSASLLATHHRQGCGQSAPYERNTQRGLHTAHQSQAIAEKMASSPTPPQNPT